MLKIGDKVKIKTSSSKQVGIVIGIIEEDIYVKDRKGNAKLYANKGAFKIKFDHQEEGASIPYSSSEIIKIEQP